MFGLGVDTKIYLGVVRFGARSPGPGPIEWPFISVHQSDAGPGESVGVAVAV